MTGDLDKVNDRLYDHEKRISKNETFINSINSDVKDIETSNRKFVWIIIGFVITAILSFVFKGAI